MTTALRQCSVLSALALSAFTAAAHARGILHRDIKPANVVRAADGTWKLIDFGVAHLPDSAVTLTGQFLGTPSYAAPEALTLGRFSPQSDVFGLAATLLEAATGARPRGDLTLADVIALQEVETISLHGRSEALIRPLLHPGTRILALTSDGGAPARIARRLHPHGVAERERRTECRRVGGEIGVPVERERAVAGARSAAGVVHEGALARRGDAAAATETADCAA